MSAGRSHEAFSNGRPRWMVAHDRIRLTGRLIRTIVSDLRKRGSRSRPVREESARIGVYAFSRSADAALCGAPSTASIAARVRTMPGRPLFSAYGFVPIEDVEDDRGGVPLPWSRWRSRSTRPCCRDSPSRAAVTLRRARRPHLGRSGCPAGGGMMHLCNLGPATRVGEQSARVEVREDPRRACSPARPDVVV